MEKGDSQYEYLVYWLYSKICLVLLHCWLVIRVQRKWVSEWSESLHQEKKAQVQVQDKTEQSRGNVLRLKQSPATFQRQIKKQQSFKKWKKSLYMKLNRAHVLNTENKSEEEGYLNSSRHFLKTVTNKVQLWSALRGRRGHKRQQTTTTTKTTNHNHLRTLPIIIRNTLGHWPSPPSSLIVAQYNDVISRDN